LKKTKDLGLHYTRSIDPTLVGYTNVGYRFDPATSKSKMGYVFLQHGVAISWKSVKQTIIATSSNHIEIIALHEVSQECIWLQSIDKSIRSNCRLPHDESPTLLYEDNNVCIAQMQVGFVKGDRTKHINPKYFNYTHDLITNQALKIRKIISTDNLVDLFTKALPQCIHCRLVQALECVDSIVWSKRFNRFLLLL